MRHHPTRRHLLIGAAAAAAASLSGAFDRAAAQAEWPTRPVRVIVPYPPGGGADTVSRILFTRLSEAFGQQFVIDNRGGAGGTIGAAAAATAAKDGTTILYDATAFSVNPWLYPRLSYDSMKDFQPVFLASLVPNLLVVHPSVQAKTVTRRDRDRQGRARRARLGVVGQRHRAALCRWSCFANAPTSSSTTFPIAAAARR